MIKRAKPPVLLAFLTAASMLLMPGCDAVMPASSPADAQGGGASAAPSSGTSSAGTSSAASSKSASQRLAKHKPRTETADILQAISYEREKNPDTVGWLTVPGTNIDNSVVQAHDNVYYLRRTERGEEDVYGCYFADFECSFGARDVLSPNTVIYGHSDLKDSLDGPRFSELFRFTDEEFARRTPVISFSTINEHMTWQVFAVFYTDLNLEYTSVLHEAAQQAALVDEARARSLYAYSAEVGGDDKILTLSTCTVKYGSRPDQRFVVMARLLPPDEAIPPQAQLTVNENPVQPAFS